MTRLTNTILLLMLAAVAIGLCSGCGLGTMPAPMPAAVPPPEVHISRDPDDLKLLTAEEFAKFQKELRDDLAKKDRQSPPPQTDPAVVKLLAELSAKMDRQPVAPSIDIAAELKGLRSEMKAAAVAPPQAQAPRAKPQWTGCVIHLDGHEGRCAPCKLLKKDIALYQEQTAASPDPHWTFGLTNNNHFQFAYHDLQDMIFPTFEYIVNDVTVHKIEGYPNEPASKGYYGPLNKIFDSHPACDHDKVKRQARARQSQSIERLGGAGSSAYQVGGSTGGYGGSGRARVSGFRADGSLQVDGDDNTTLGEVRAAVADEQHAQEMWNYRYKRAVQQTYQQQPVYQSSYGWPAYQSYYNNGGLHCVGGMCFPN